MFTSAAKLLLKRANTKVIIADIGSAGGFHARVLEMGDEALRIGFDADPAECERLNKIEVRGERHINAAIGREGETVTVELHKKRQTSSVFPFDMDRLNCYPEVERFQTEDTISFKTRSLDNVCKEENIPRIDYIKADIEGSELAAIQGFTGPLLMAEIEVTFHPFRKGIPLFHEVMEYMRSRGFLLIDLRRTFWHPNSGAKIQGLSTKGFVFLGDALFIMDPFQESTQRLLSSEEIRARYLALLCMYGYAAEALMIAEVLERASIMQKKEFEETSVIIQRESKRFRRLKLFGLGRIFRIAERWIKLPLLVRSGLFAGPWSQADREVGNWP